MSPSYTDQPAELITYIFPDFNAVQYFQRDFESLHEFSSVQYSQVSGFDIYLVEQWVNHRNISSIISTYTGNANSQVSVVKFTCIKKPSRFYPVRFQEYLNELIVNHAKIKQMNEADAARKIKTFDDFNDPNFDVKNYDIDEFLMVTNISSLPSNLSLTPIVSGDARSIESDFVVNSNLKKLQCSGRSISLVTANISDASEDKFRQMYKVYNVNVPIRFAIKELINLVQTCLFYFDLLDVRYCDGFLCSKTEEAIVNWWNLIGLPHFNYKPNLKSCILNPTSVSAILSMLLSARLRLQTFGGCDVPRDPFDFENFMISIGEFQKQIKFEKKRKLDLETLSRLISITNNKLKHEKSSDSDELSRSATNETKDVTTTPQFKRNKNYAKEIKKLTSVVKSTVQDRISTVNRPDDETYFDKGSNRIRERLAKLGDTPNPLMVETLDLEQLVKTSLVGRTLKILWYGPRNEDDDAPSSPPSQHSHGPSHAPHHTHPHRHVHKHRDKNYKFVSLKDAIYSQRLSLNNSGKYSRGLNLNRMRLGLQRNIWVNQKKFDDSTPLNRKPSMKAPNDSLSNGLSIVDQLLKIPSDYVSLANTDDVCSRTSSNKNHDKFLQQFNGRLTRRMSYPFYEKEVNLIVLEMCQDTSIRVNPLKRTSSMSLIDVSASHVPTIEKLAQDYLGNMRTLIQFDSLKKRSHARNVENSNKFAELNQHLTKFKSAHRQLEQSKHKFGAEDLVGGLEVSLSNLSANIDRLVYESRIVIKRINEIEQATTTMTDKLTKTTTSKMNELINNVVFSNRFNQIFKKEERNQIIMKLTDDKSIIEKIDNEPWVVKEQTVVRMVVVFVYEMIAFIFHLFQFDRSKMNLDRIRQTWSRLDPNRKYINRAYEYFGYDNEAIRESRGSVSSLSST